MSMKCSWPGCSSSFSSVSTLNRHIKCVHVKERSYICPKPECGATFRSSYDLKRHEQGVHIKKQSYKCDQCSRAFNIYDTLRRHKQTVHSADKPVFICAECGKRFVRKDVLVDHISSNHGDHEHFKCHDCGCKFRRKYQLRTHIFIKHCEQVDVVRVKNNNVNCISCGKSFQHLYQLNEHYSVVHNVDLNPKTLSFRSQEEFFSWKKDMEDSTVTRFLVKAKNKRKILFKCHRSGIYKIKSSDRKRAPLRRGSKKLNGVCPASIRLHLSENDPSCIATFIQSHVGHAQNDINELKFTFLRKEDRERLAELVVAGVPKQQILDGQLKECDDFMSANVKRNSLLNYKDLWNIEKSFNVKCQENLVMPKKDDSKNVEVFIEKFKESILFYKRPGESCPEEFSEFDLKDDDFVLIFMCRSQEKMLKKHGSKIVCIDGANCVNPNVFILHTLLVLDYNGEGFPGAFVLSNRNDRTLISIFLRCIKQKLGEIITPRALMGDIDMQEPYCNAWIEEMGQPEEYLHCMWYIWQEWKKHLPKVKDKGHENHGSSAKCKQDLYNLSVEPNVELFHESLDKFLTPTNDRKVDDFLKYFEREYCNESKWMCWSYAYRLHFGADTNTHLETFHRTLKHLHGCGKTVKDMCTGLRFIVNLVRQKINVMLGNATCGKITPRLTALREAHKVVQEKGEVSVLKIDDVWLVPSFQTTRDGCEVMSVVRKVRDVCPAKQDEDIRTCYLICTECNECAHIYSCSCVENAIRSHMCEHIHAVLCFERATNDNNGISWALDEPQIQTFDENSQPSALENVAIKKVVDLATEKRRIAERFSRILEQMKTQHHYETVTRYLDHMEGAFE